MSLLTMCSACVHAKLLQLCPTLCDPGIKPMSLMSCALAGGFFTTSTTWEAPYDPAIPLLGIYPEKTIIKKDTYTHQCSSQPYLYWPGHGISLDVH